MTTKGKRISAIEKLLADGWFGDAAQATSWIMMGRVYADGQAVRTKGERISADAAIVVRGRDRKYVNRGGFKLEGALRDLGVDVSGKVALDAGASTGGFTDCLLQAGAARVYAVDAGFGQLAGALRQDPRVVNLERTNLADARLLALEPRPGLSTLDLSYLSLRQAIPLCARIMDGHGEIVALVKPLFEVESSEMRATGRIEDKAVYVDVLEKLTAHVNGPLHCHVYGVASSPVRGNRNTLEFFLGICLDGGRERLPPGRLLGQIRASVDKASAPGNPSAPGGS